MKTLLVTLISDQTIPNVQFIKDRQDANTHFLFVSTKKMEEKGVKTWIKNVCNIAEENTRTIVVDQFSLEDIESKLNELNYDDYDKLTVNVTGGTKIMSHAVTEFFKEFAAEIFYLTGVENKILQVHPKTKQSVKSLTNQINLDEYIRSHGFEMKEGELSGIPFEYTEQFLHLFLSDESSFSPVLLKLRELRQDKKKKKEYDINTVEGLLNFLIKIEFPLSDKNQSIITRSEIKYLTGEWFEEYIYYHLKDEVNIPDENIKTGITLSKNNTKNEFDVIFIYNGNLYTIECKTSIINKEFNLMLDTIYKVTALQKNLGLYSKSNIFILNSNKDVQEAHLKRGKLLFNIDIFCREDIETAESIAKLLKII